MVKVLKFLLFKGSERLFSMSLLQMPWPSLSSALWVDAEWNPTWIESRQSVIICISQFDSPKGPTIPNIYHSMFTWLTLGCTCFAFNFYYFKVKRSENRIPFVFVKFLWAKQRTNLFISFCLLFFMLLRSRTRQKLLLHRFALFGFRFFSLILLLIFVSISKTN